MIRTIWSAIAGCALLWPLAGWPAADGAHGAPAAAHASAEKRVALVIGNAAYPESPLNNPGNDARDVSAKLSALGFDVIERTDLTVRQIGSALREFRSKLGPGAVAVVFYAGHGLQIKGENYLVAVDAEIASEEDVPNQSLAVKQIFDVLDDARTGLNLVFLDACRNNPFVRRFRSVAPGLAKIEAPSGTIISYATRPGSVALDGSGHNGLYTQYLLAAMDRTAEEPVELMLKTVARGVKVASKGEQEPWMEGSIEGDFCFGGCANAPPPSGSHVIVDPAPPWSGRPPDAPQRQPPATPPASTPPASSPLASLTPASPSASATPAPSGIIGEMLVYASEKEVRAPFQVLGPVRYKSLGKFQSLTLESALPFLREQARALGANAVIIDESHTVVSGIWSRGIEAKGRAVLIER
jgi:hypothetical protein